MDAFSSVKVGLGAAAILIDQLAAREAVQPITPGERMGRLVRQQMSETPPGGRRRLESAITPARVQIQTLDRRVIDDGRAIHAHVHDATPGAQHPYTAN